MTAPRITILSSRENLVWISMNEIIPWIERLWTTWGKEHRYEVDLFYVEETPLPTIMNSLMRSEFAIMTCFTTRLAGTIHIAREKISLPFKLAVYLHNQATIGCWPFYEWKMGNYLNTGDVFIGSCTRDKASMELNFSNANTMIHPFSLDDLIPVRPALTVKSGAHLVFIGRISPQKNLHTLLWSLSLLKKLAPEFFWTLDLYGKEDHLGSPLMGIDNFSYLQELQALVKKLNLSTQVNFKGFMDRQKIQEEMSSHRRIFIVPSLHSDENFGMAALRCLSQGHLAILSDWGGHRDYQDYFPDSLELLPVREGSYGPWISALEIAEAIIKSGQKGPLTSRETPAYYQKKSISKALDAIVSKLSLSDEKLERTPLALRVHAKRKEFLEQEIEKKKRGGNIKGGKIFTDFQDPDSFEYFGAYGMKSVPNLLAGKSEEAPWVSHDQGTTLVNDPQKGSSTFSGDADDVMAWLKDQGCLVQMPLKK